MPVKVTAKVFFIALLSMLLVSCSQQDSGISEAEFIDRLAESPSESDESAVKVSVEFGGHRIEHSLDARTLAEIERQAGTKDLDASLSKVRELMKDVNFTPPSE